MASKQLQALLLQRAAKISQAKAVNAAAEKETRDLTEAEAAQINGILDEITALDGKIEMQSRLDEAERADMARTSSPIYQASGSSALELPGNPNITGGTPQVVHDNKRGFSSYGDFAMQVWKASKNMGVDKRLVDGGLVPEVVAATGTGVTNSGADGGFLIPPEFSTRIYQHSLEEDALLPYCSQMPISGSSMSLPVDEGTPWGSSGVTAYWQSEASQATGQKPKLEQVELKLKKLMALVRLTEELTEDAVALDTYLSTRSGAAIRYKTNDAIVNGDGVGKPLGIKNSTALVSVTKVTGQAAGTFVLDNAAQMFARCTSQAGGVWIIGNDVFPQMIQFQVGNFPVWLPPGAIQGLPAAGMLMGRPVIMSSTCQPLGTAGDAYFANLGAYQIITKAQGLETATSMHLWFDYYEQAFRVTFRIDGQPMVKNAITPPQGSYTRSPFVVTQTR